MPTWIPRWGARTPLPTWLFLLLGTCLMGGLLGGWIWVSQQQRRQVDRQLMTLAQLQVKDPNRAYQLARTLRQQAIDLGLTQQSGQAAYWLARIDRDNSHFGQFYSLRAFRLATYAQQQFQRVQDSVWQAKTHLLQASIQAFGLLDMQAKDANGYEAHATAHLASAKRLLEHFPAGSQKQSLQSLYYRHRAVLRIHHADRLSGERQQVDSLLPVLPLLQASLDLAQQAGDWEGQGIAARIQGNVHEDLTRKYRLAPLHDTAAAVAHLVQGEQALQLARSLFEQHGDQVGISNVAHKQADLLSAKWLLAPDSLKLIEALDAYRENLHSTHPYRPGYQLFAMAKLYHGAYFYMPPGYLAWRATWIDSAKYYYEQATLAAIGQTDLPQVQQALYEWEGICGEDACLARIAHLRDSASQTIPQLAVEIENNVAEEIRQADLAAAAQQARRTRHNLLFGAGLLVLFLLLAFYLLWQQRQLAFLRSELQQSLRLAQAKMNPHFIGNTLNSIDSLINSGQAEKASKYLVRFSRLANAILQHADKSHLPLQEEVRTLRHFLDLERLRLNERFEYELTVAESLPVHSLYLPPMLLQPLVENAIWHGLQPKISGSGVGGNLQVAFLPHPQDEGLLCCVVEDDGIGREKAREMQKNQPPRQRASQSTALIQQRLQALGYQATIEMEDLLDAAGQAAGTRVTLVLPRIFSPNL